MEVEVRGLLNLLWKQLAWRLEHDLLQKRPYRRLPAPSWGRRKVERERVSGAVSSLFLGVRARPASDVLPSHLPISSLFRALISSHRSSKGPCIIFPNSGLTLRLQITCLPPSTTPVSQPTSEGATHQHTNTPLLSVPFNSSKFLDF